MTFWEHLDVLRSVLIKTALAVIACGLLAFFFKDTMFDIVLAPKDASFVTYRLFQHIGSQLQLPAMDLFSIKLINTGLA